MIDPDIDCCTTGTQIDLASKEDLAAIAAIHAACFSRQCRSEEWISCHMAAAPLKRVFTAHTNGHIIGYAIWGEKSGFRSQAVIELEQIAVLPAYQGRGVASDLIGQSRDAVLRAIAERGASVRAVVVTTRADNNAQRLYRRTLGAEIVATIPRLFGEADEIVMLKELPHYTI